jgi:peptidoglycan/xylan/chitin deacetylase (PgdA/CDA1 family)
MPTLGRRRCIAVTICCLLGFSAHQVLTAQSAPPAAAFRWPTGKRAAVSLSFDDGRTSQVDEGLALLRKIGIKVTFFVTPGAVAKRLDGWKQAAGDGHEIGNHSLSHPCSGNYAFSSQNALETYSLDSMAQQLDEANARIEALLGVKPTTFAYPCGQKFVGRGTNVKSYVPLVGERFLVGRGYMDESPNNPAVADLAQAMGTVFDDMDFLQMKTIVDAAAADGRWVIFAGHEIGSKKYQTTDARALEQLGAYLKDPANGIWLGTVAEVGAYVRERQREASPR